MNPSLSPDGRVVYFSWIRDGKERDICRIRAGEQAPVCLTSSPVPETEPRCSPDGRTVAFLRNETDGITTLMMIPAEGGKEALLGRGYIHSFEWSRDGKMLIASAANGLGDGHNLRAFSLADRKWHEVTSPSDSISGDWYPSLSPDGQHLTFVRSFHRSSAQILSVPVGSDLRPLSAAQVLVNLPGDIRHPVWSADARNVFFLFGSISNHSLWRVPADGNAPPQRLPEAGTNLSHLTIAGSSLVMARDLADSDIWRSDLAMPGGSVVRTARLEGSTYVEDEPRISPDGRQVLFQSDRSGEPHYWVADIDGGRQRQLTDSKIANDPALRWLPGKSELLLTGFTQGAPVLRVVDLGFQDRMPARTLPFRKPITIGVSRDGQFCYLTELRKGRPRLFRVSLSTLEAREIVEAPAVAATESPDGRTLYYCARQASFGLWAVPVNGGKPERVLDSIYHRSFAVGSAGIYYVSRADDRTISYHDLESGRSRPVVEADKRLSWGIDVSRNERTLIYSLVEHEGTDLVLMNVNETHSP